MSDRRQAPSLVVVGALVTLAAAAGVPPGAVAASAKSLPKGTPYAAEVKATITGTVKATESSTFRTESVCEAEPQVGTDQRIVNLTWKVTFPQITVPVATAKDLGKAFKRLHVKVTPTADGDGGLTGGSLQVSGTGPSNGNTCDQVNYGAVATLRGQESDPFLFEKVVDVDGDGNQAKRSLFGFQLGSLGSASPATLERPIPGDSDTVRVVDSLLGRLPEASNNFLNNPPPEWDQLTLDVPTEYFKPLVHRPSVTFPLTDAGTTDCGSATDPGVSAYRCSLARSLNYTIKLERRTLYKTVRAYPR